MKNSFDTAAASYDSIFTNSNIGRLQREIIYSHLEKFTAKNKKILEVNCGTGVDAIWLAKKNKQVVATDISEEMIKIASKKEAIPNLKLHQLDINDLGITYNESEFDMVFSNFGGLNCLSEIELLYFFQNAATILTKKGQLVAVIMPKDTVWERIYFSLKLQFQKAFRRNKKMVIANVDGEQVATFYYNPIKIKTLASNHFQFVNQFPVGFFIPPSYLEPFFNRHKWILKGLNFLESKITNWSKLARISDHYLIVFEKK